MNHHVLLNDNTEARYYNLQQLLSVDLHYECYFRFKQVLMATRCFSAISYTLLEYPLFIHLKKEKYKFTIFFIK